MVEAYDGMGRLLLGLSRVANFGAVHAAALSVEHGRSLLSTAEALDGPMYVVRTERGGEMSVLCTYESVLEQGSASMPEEVDSGGGSCEVCM